jgi:hypothetical protein
MNQHSIQPLVPFYSGELKYRVMKHVFGLGNVAIFSSAFSVMLLPVRREGREEHVKV